MLEMQMLLWPDETQLQRDLALVLARCGLSQPARQWLGSYLKANPDDPQNRDLRQLLEVLAG
jgi:regulator of sirC expression with transglutaminase-like and TPR domain